MAHDPPRIACVVPLLSTLRACEPGVSVLTPIRWTLLLVTAGCSFHNGAKADADIGGMDAIPSTITIAGTAFSLGGSGSAGLAATIEAYPANDVTGSGTALASTIADSTGAFSLAIATGGSAVDAVVKGTPPAGSGSAAYMDTYLWLPQPLTSYTAVPIQFLTPMVAGLAGGVCNVPGGGYSGSDAMIGLKVLTAPTGTNGTGVPGAIVTSSPAAQTYCYDDAMGNPQGSATSTGSDGIAILFNVAPGSTTVSATKTGNTFKSNTAYGVPGALTTTVIFQSN
jgi:hypothetical protein